MSPFRRALLAQPICMALLACGSSGNNGALPDGGAGSEGGVTDAGGGNQTDGNADAGVVLDSGVDSGAADSGSSMDAGPGPSQLVVSSFTNGAIEFFPVAANGNVAPARTITGLTKPRGLFASVNTLWVAHQGNVSVDSYDVNASGAAVPLTQIKGATTTLVQPISAFVYNGEIFCGDSSNAVKVWKVGDTGDVAPARTITSTGPAISESYYAFVDSGELYIASYSSSQVLVFNTTDSGATAPKRIFNIPANTTGVYVFGGELIVSGGQAAIYTYDKMTTTLKHTITDSNLGAVDQCLVLNSLIYCADFTSSSVNGFTLDSNGAPTPQVTIAGATTGLSGGAAGLVFH